MSLTIDPRQEDPYRAYCRSSSTDKRELEARIKNLYQFASDDQSVRCLVTPSGMAAINSVMYGLALKQPEGVFVLTDELYCDVYRSVKYLQRTFPRLKVEYVDVRDQDRLLDLFDQHQVTLFHLESCSNPSGQMISWPILKKLKKKSPKCVISVDNTWLTSVIFNPLKVFGVDLVLESLSKYNSNGLCIGGMLIGRRRLLSSMEEWIRVNGLFVGGDHCRLFLGEINSLVDRVQRGANIAQRVAEVLDQDQRVTVIYPGLQSHPTGMIYQQYCQLGPAVIWIHIRSNCSLDDLNSTLRESEFKIETSFGSARSKIDPWPRLGGSGDYFLDSGGPKNSQQGAWVRLAIGYQSDPEKIIESFGKMVNELDKF